MPYYTSITLLLVLQAFSFSSAIHEFRRIGCFADTRSNRALPEYCKHVGSEADPQLACYNLAKAKGYIAFGLQNGGECWTGPNAHTTYGIHGQTGRCSNNLGGAWANDVFIKDYYHKGCYLDGSPKAITEFLGRFTGPDAVTQCYQLVKQKEYSTFGVQNGGDCYTSYDAKTTYDKYGAGSGCKDGKGSLTSNDVYFINAFDPYIRCTHGKGVSKTKGIALCLSIWDTLTKTLLTSASEKSWSKIGDILAFRMAESAGQDHTGLQPIASMGVVQDAIMASEQHGTTMSIDWVQNIRVLNSWGSAVFVMPLGGVERTNGWTNGAISTLQAISQTTYRVVCPSL